MNASIDFWLDELDTQITELSAAELRDLRAGVPPSTMREPLASGAVESRDERAAADRHGSGPSWSNAPGAVLA